MTTGGYLDGLYSAGDFEITAGSGKFGRLADLRPAYVQPILEWRWE